MNKIILDDEFFKDKIDFKDFEENIYNQLSKTMARSVDIDLAKTPLVDILTGYTRYVILEKQLEAYENMRKEAINKLKEHKKDLDYEPWSLYEVRGSILFNLSNILNKVGSSDE